VRDAPAEFDPTLKATLDEAKGMLAAGDVPAAMVVYERAWTVTTAAQDHHHASVVAHMAGVAEPDLDRKLRWNLDALREADATEDRERVAGFYSSLYGNLAFSYAMLGDLDTALRYQELAVSRLPDIEPGPYRDRVVSGTERQTERLRAKIADRDAATAG